MARVIKAGVDAPDGPGPSAVLKLTDFMAEAKAVVLEARKEAARIVIEAAAKAEQITTAAADRGYQEGFARGQNDGYADGQRVGSRQGLETSAEAATEALSVARRIAEELAARREELCEQARRELLEFALAVAERIVGRVAARDVSAAQGNLVKALEMAGFARSITVKVNPAQLAALGEHCRQAVEALAIQGRVELVADETVRPGGVKVPTGGGQIDATVEGQFAHIVETLLGPPHADGPEGSYESHGSDEAEDRPQTRARAAARQTHEGI
jgi:flagellar assembly protein FliH